MSLPMTLDEAYLVKVNQDIWNRNRPVILIRTHPNHPHLKYCTCLWSSVYADISRHSSNGWGIKNEHSDVLIYGCFKGFGIGRNQEPDNYCFGNELVITNQPDLIRLTSAMKESFDLLRS